MDGDVLLKIVVVVRAKLSYDAIIMLLNAYPDAIKEKNVDVENSNIQFSEACEQ
jgi:hypothetical protein